MLHPAACSARILAAKLVMLFWAVAKYRLAPGAMSSMISIMAVPSSPAPACPASTVRQGGVPQSAGRSTVAWLGARLVAPSDSTPIFKPVPSTLYTPCASTVWCVKSPSVSTAPCPMTGIPCSFRMARNCLRTGAALRLKSGAAYENRSGRMNSTAPCAWVSEPCLGK